MKILEAEGIHFVMNAEINPERLPEGFDAYCICIGTPTPRDLKVPGRELKGVYFALELLSQQNRILAGTSFSSDELINAKGKNVLVIGGGDTGSDCIGTCIRQGAKSVTQIEIMSKPPVNYNPATPWPEWPRIFKTTSSHEEGCTRRWLINTNNFIGKDGHVVGAELEEIEWSKPTDGSRPQMISTGKKEIFNTDMVLLAMGFLRNPEREFPENVFVAGDAKNGATLVVKAMASGRETACKIDKYLKEK